MKKLIYSLFVLMLTSLILSCTDDLDDLKPIDRASEFPNDEMFSSTFPNDPMFSRQ